MSDLLYGLRLLRSRPGYAAITILTIALGVGAVTTLFSVAYGVLLRPLSWANGDGLVRVIYLSSMLRTKGWRDLLRAAEIACGTRSGLLVSFFGSPGADSPAAVEKAERAGLKVIC